MKKQSFLSIWNSATTHKLSLLRCKKLICVQGLPDESEVWKAAIADVSITPLSTILGWFESNPVESIGVDSISEDAKPLVEQSLWLVCKFEGMQPAQAYFVAPRSEPAMKLPFIPSSMQKRHKMLRAMISGTFSSLITSRFLGKHKQEHATASCISDLHIDDLHDM